MKRHVEGGRERSYSENGKQSGTIMMMIRMMMIRMMMMIGMIMMIEWPRERSEWRRVRHLAGGREGERGGCFDYVIRSIALVMELVTMVE